MLVRMQSGTAILPLWKTLWKFLKKLKIELPYDPAIILLGVYPKDINVVTRRGTCTPVFMAAMSTIVIVLRAEMSFNR